jgi:hypothetical protein
MSIILIADPKKGSLHQIDAPTIEKAIENIIDIIMLEMSDVDLHDDDQTASLQDAWDTSRLIIQVLPSIEMSSKLPAFAIIKSVGTTKHKI